MVIQWLIETESSVNVLSYLPLVVTLSGLTKHYPFSIMMNSILLELLGTFVPLATASE
jgi:hypothetical protein